MRADKWNVVNQFDVPMPINPPSSQLELDALAAMPPMHISQHHHAPVHTAAYRCNSYDSLVSIRARLFLVV